MSAEGQLPKDCEIALNAIADLAVEGERLFSAPSEAELRRRVASMWENFIRSDLDPLQMLELFYCALEDFLDNAPSAWQPAEGETVDALLQDFVDCEFVEQPPWCAVALARRWQASLFKNAKVLADCQRMNGKEFATLLREMQFGDLYKEGAIAAARLNRPSLSIELNHICLKAAELEFSAAEFVTQLLWDTTVILYRDSPLPGMRAWSNDAALDLLQFSLGNQTMTREAFDKMKQRLGLKHSPKSLITRKTLERMEFFRGYPKGAGLKFYAGWKQKA